MAVVNNRWRSIKEKVIFMCVFHNNIKVPEQTVNYKCGWQTFDKLPSICHAIDIF